MENILYIYRRALVLLRLATMKNDRVRFNESALLSRCKSSAVAPRAVWKSVICANARLATHSHTYTYTQLILPINRGR